MSQTESSHHEPFPLIQGWLRAANERCYRCDDRVQDRSFNARRGTGDCFDLTKLKYHRLLRQLVETVELHENEITYNVIRVLVTILAFLSVSWARSCVCVRDFKPVCGRNGQTYSNSCEMACDGQTLKHMGACRR
ncbi:Leech-derived tryptase inhibitor C [Eumeta japonica]|uniref:Leech-derived tryptase inhibitor C n=1 Tax=Eumeta variegata TaxID=151549 RepID=A0A4C1TR61_EUMVA|nr:Leech-derived tryptase inhibitor C [Eumeta japonica]